MKRTISIAAVSLSIALASLVPAAASAANSWYCGPGAYNTTYRATFLYPTGSYWQTQIAAYPDYYAANNAYYLAAYGC